MIEPKPFIEFFEWKKLPKSERPKVGNCDEHGEFEIKPVEVLNRVIGCTSVCPECSGRYKEWRLKMDEIEQREAEKKLRIKNFENKLSSYGVSPRHFEKSFDNYIAETKEQKYALETCRYVAQKAADGVCKNIIMVGSVGTGKTHLAASMCRFMAAQKEPKRVKLVTVTEMIRYYRSSYSNDNDLTEDQAIANMTNQELLIIDELGTSKGDDKELNILFEVINNRYEYKRPTVLISNLSIEKVKEILGQRIIDRLKEDGCRVLGMQWESHRETHKGQF